MEPSEFAVFLAESKKHANKVLSEIPIHDRNQLGRKRYCRHEKSFNVCHKCGFQFLSPSSEGK